MAIHPDIIDSLKSLSCFTEIQEVALLADGLSHTCVKVTTAQQIYFAKKLNSKTTIAEVNAAMMCAEQGISPCVIYQNQRWLVTEFVEGKTLIHEELDSKIAIALKLMVRCHHLSVSKYVQSIPPLDTRLSANALLINPAPFLVPHLDTLDQVTQSLTDSIKVIIFKTEPLNVLCHGDINFTNILLEDNRRSWLIDFECAHRAPAEFDLAMFVAVNDIPIDNLNKIVDRYTALVPSVSINLALLDHYILYSFYINGLWYLENDLPSLAATQWTAFDNFASKQSINLVKLMSIIA